MAGIVAWDGRTFASTPGYATTQQSDQAEFGYGPVMEAAQRKIRPSLRALACIPWIAPRSLASPERSRWRVSGIGFCGWNLWGALTDIARLIAIMSD